MNSLTRTLLFVGLLVTTASAQGLDHRGTEFLVGFLRNDGGGTPPTPTLVFNAEAPTLVRVRYPIDGSIVDQSVLVGNGATSQLELPVATSSGWAPSSVSDNAILVESLDGREFGLVLANLRVNISETALALPTDALGTEYVAIDYPGIVNQNYGGSEFVVIARDDATVINITPNVQVGTTAPGTTLTVALNRGEGYCVRGLAGSQSLAGSTIQASQPVFVVSGNRCVNVPFGTLACDNIFEVAHPVTTWGSQYILTDVPDRPEGSVYGIMARLDDTNVTLDGAVLTTLSANEVFYTDFLAGNHLLAGDKPIFCVQLVTGYFAPGANLGDPAMTNLAPTSQFSDEYSFTTVGLPDPSEYWIVVTAPTISTANMLLDGVPLDSQEFVGVPGTNDSVGMFEIGVGDYELVGSEPFGLTVLAHGNAQTYHHPAGVAFVLGDIPSGGDGRPPVCELYVQATSSSIGGVVRDDRPPEDTNGNGLLDPGEDLNGNGQLDVDTGLLSVGLDSASSGLTMFLDPFDSADPSTSFSIVLDSGTQSGSGEVVVTDLWGNTTRTPVGIDLNGSVLFLGEEIQGTGGVAPTIGTQAASIGSNFTVELEGGPQLTGLLAFGTSQIRFPFRTGLVHLAPITVYPIQANATGLASVDFGIADDPSLAGFTYLWQAAFLDPQAAEGVSLSTLMATIF